MARYARTLPASLLVEPLEPRILRAIDFADIPRTALALPSAADINVVRHADLDADGDQDLLVAAEGVVYSLLNTGDASFERPAALVLPDTMPRRVAAVEIQRLDFADLTGDGALDILVSGFARTSQGTPFFRSWVLRGRGDGSFAFHSLAYNNWLHLSSFAALALDSDGDGAEDVITSTGLRVVGLENGRLKLKGPLVRGGSWASVSSSNLADIDADGDIDILTRRNVALTPVLLRNTGAGFIAQDLLADTGLPTPIAMDLSGDGLPEVVFAGSVGFGDSGFVVLAALANTSGSISTTLSTLYRESWVDLLARGEHSPDLAHSVPFRPSLNIQRVQNTEGDQRPEITIHLDSQVEFYAPAFHERYAVILAAADDSPPPATLGAYTAEPAPRPDIPVDPYLSLRSLATRADFDGDGREDAALIRRSPARLGEWEGAGNLVYIHLAASQAPIADIADISGGLPNGTGIAPGSTVEASVRFALPAMDSIREVNAFIDSNHNGLFDQADRRIAVSTTDMRTSQRTMDWPLTLTHRSWWGVGLRTVFFVGIDWEGRVSVPITDRVYIAP